MKLEEELDDLFDINIGAFGMSAYLCPQSSKPRYYKPLTPIWCINRYTEM